VYGPLDGDTLQHLARVATFNARRDNPTAWELDVRAGPDYLTRFAHEQPGNTVVLSGRNKPKIDLMRLAVENGLHVIADKPWVIDHDDFPKLEEVLRQADLRDVIVWDVLTERYEITNWLQRELVRDPEVFGTWRPGTAERPALELRSVHCLKKTVHGQPLVRPWWWFDPAVSGEAMADVGAHLADLALWLVAPEQEVDYRTDVTMIAADRAPLLLSEDDFRQVTRLAGFPPELAGRVVNGQLYYAGNNSATLALRGVHVRLATEWEFAGAGDTHHSAAHGTRATVSVRHAPGARPDLFVSAAPGTDHALTVQRIRDKCEELQREFAGMSVTDLGTEARVEIPEGWRTGHEEHFGAVMDEFVRYFQAPRTLPAWERPNALARYYITTKAVELARAS